MKLNKDLNGNNILNYIHKRVILIYKVPLSWVYNTDGQTLKILIGNRKPTIRVYISNSSRIIFYFILEIIKK